MAIFCTFSSTSNHLHPLQNENCDIDSRVVVDEDDNGKFRLQWVKNLNKAQVDVRFPHIMRTITEVLNVHNFLVTVRACRHIQVYRYSMSYDN